MATSTAAAETTLHVRRTFAAPRERVFHAWTDPQELSRWWCPDEYTNTGIEADPRPGGLFRFGMRRSSDGHQATISGRYLEVKPPERVVYTWNWDGFFPGSPETRVTVEFLESGSGTEVVLTHENFPHQTMRDGHGKGWNAVFNRLAKALSSGGTT